MTKDRLFEESPLSISERSGKKSFQRSVQEKVFTVFTLAGNIVLIPESDLDKALVRGGRVLADDVFP